MLTERHIESIGKALASSNDGRWVDLHVDTINDHQAVRVIVWVSDAQGDDDENVESILRTLEQLLEKHEWLAAVRYDIDDSLETSIASVSDAGAWPNRHRHGSAADVAAAADPAGGAWRKRWLLRRGS